MWRLVKIGLLYWSKNLFFLNRIEFLLKTYEGIYENHPDYVDVDHDVHGPSQGDDIAVITLTESSSINVPIVARDMAAINKGEEVCIAGWGYTDAQATRAANLKILRHLTKTTCDEQIGKEFCVYSDDGVAMKGA